LGEEAWELKLEEASSSWDEKPGASHCKVSWGLQGCKARSWPMVQALHRPPRENGGIEGKQQSVLETKERHRKSWSF
jgi:hypothetical protein